MATRTAIRRKRMEIITSLTDCVAERKKADIEKAPLVFGGDDSLHADMHLAFAASHGGFRTKMAEAMKSQGTTKVHRLVHDLKRSAGILGFRTIETEASRLLSRLVSDAPLTRCDASVENLAGLVEAVVPAERTMP